MDLTRTIYYNDKPLILTTDTEAYIKEHTQAEKYNFFTGATSRSFAQALLDLDKPGINGVIIEDVSREALLEQMNIMYRTIYAGGGVVYNENGAVLMIYRRGKWDLPKGKLDEGEQIGECALREVKEETGLVHLELGAQLCNTHHIYNQNGEQYLKETTWFKMTGTLQDKLKPQKEENILEARWIGADEIAPFAAKSYSAVRDVLKLAGF